MSNTNNKLFVGNLSFNTTENDLQDTFAAHGTVVEANLMMDRATGRARGFGFVTMPDATQARAAIAGLNGTSLGGRPLTINEARQREERGGPRRPRWTARAGGAGPRPVPAVRPAAAAKRRPPRRGRPA